MLSLKCLRTAGRAAFAVLPGYAAGYASAVLARNDQISAAQFGLDTTHSISGGAWQLCASNVQWVNIHLHHTPEQIDRHLGAWENVMGGLHH